MAVDEVAANYDFEATEDHHDVSFRQPSAVGCELM
jgi:hypothetical protein